MINFICREKTFTIIFPIILFIYPLSNLFHFLKPQDIFNVNIYSLICFISLYLIFFFNIFFKREYLNYFFFLITFLFFSILINFYSNTNNLKFLTQYEIGITFFVFLLISLMLVNKKNNNLISNIIILSCLVQSVFAIFNEIVTKNQITFFNYGDENRQTGFLLNANLFSSFISMGFILNLHKAYNFFHKKKYNLIFNFIFGVIIYVAIFYSESRFSIYFSFFYTIIFFIYLFYKSFTFKEFLIFSFILFFIITCALTYLFLNIDFDNRLTLGFSDNIRVLKYYLGIKTILLDSYDLLFGMDRLNFTELRILDTRLSDNSIIYLVMYFGLPFTCILFLSISYIILKYSKTNILSLSLYLSLIFNLFLTGAIFWHVYLLYFITTYMILFKKIE